MPSLEQCNVTGGTVTTLTTTLEVFDKYKSESGKDSDSDESLHLVMEEECCESQSAISNGKSAVEETTEDNVVTNKTDSVDGDGTVGATAPLRNGTSAKEVPSESTDTRTTIGDEEEFKQPADVKRLPAAAEQKDKERGSKNDATAAGPETAAGKSEEDDSDLLDISMIRETEEDDACAIADAIEESTAIEEANKEDDLPVAGEKSDEESTGDKLEIVEETTSDLERDQDSSDGGMADDSAAVCENEAPEANDAEDVRDVAAPDPEVGVVAATADEQTANEKDEAAASPRDNGKENQEGAVDSDVKSDTFDVPPPAKRTRSAVETDPENETPAKKTRLSNGDASSGPSETPLAVGAAEENGGVLQMIGSFAKFMQCRKMTERMTRSDLEQFCVQKICETIALRSAEAELYQTVRKHERTIETLRKDLQQLIKQSRDLEIVNRKLLTELTGQNPSKRPVMPLKITRSVGLQVRLNAVSDCGSGASAAGSGVAASTGRKRQLAPTLTPLTKPYKRNSVGASDTSVSSSSSTSVSSGNGAVFPKTVSQAVNQQQPQQQQKRSLRTLAPATSTLRSPVATTPVQTASLLSQALQKRTTVATKSPTAAPKATVDGAKPSANSAGVIDLTDEDEKRPKASLTGSNSIKIVNGKAGGGGGGSPGKNVLINKLGTITKNGKQIMSKSPTITSGIRIPAGSMITTTANGSAQMLYVLPTIGSNASGQQKLAIVNLQATNGVISQGVLNGAKLPTVTTTPTTTSSNKTTTIAVKQMRNKHPAPLPIAPKTSANPGLKPLLPKPILSIRKTDTGIILQWKMPYTLDNYEAIASYQLYAYQETSATPSTDMWKKVGDVKALALPMACTLTQFADKNKYYFAVRSVDVHKRIGAFSDPEEISL